MVLGVSMPLFSHGARWWIPGCGDSIVTIILSEQCDDGNIKNDDGCSSACILEMPQATLVATPDF
ncbi:TPA: hypothetical protein DCZ39_00075 [Patescibacteria group bacterium]|nr:hypothetical protein [Candidatus Gracilibacteria bacterium]